MSPLVKLWAILALACVLPACAHQQGIPDPVEVIPEKPAPLDPVTQPQPDVVSPPVVIDDPAPIYTPEPETPPAPVEPVIEVPLPAGYSNLTSWRTSNPLPALLAFRKSCEKFYARDPQAFLNPNLPQYGQYRDWETACFSADYIQDDADSARMFFEQFFSPVALSTSQTGEGLLTGYYEPEISVRSRPDAQYSEPILGKPYQEKNQTLSRADISPAIAPVIGFGTPIDVFFMQIQGSGQIVFDDGRKMRAAYAANNGKPYKSIGSVLIRRGEMTKDEASKQSIEAWMQRKGPLATRALMNENPRYIFFAAEDVPAGEGPRGAMGVPLIAQGSMAIDPRYHPYGALLWLDTTLPQSGGDYIGQEAGLLVSAQDTGSAIRGPLRGDLFFGSGFEAGDRAGVMKHKARFTMLLPIGLAMRRMPLN